MKTYGGVDVWNHVFLNSVLISGEWSAPRLDSFTPRERAPGTHCIGGCVGPRAGLNDMEKWKFLPSPGLELRHLGRPVRSQSLYRLSYPGSSSSIQILKERLCKFCVLQAGVQVSTVCWLSLAYSPRCIRCRHKPSLTVGLLQEQHPPPVTEIPPLPIFAIHSDVTWLARGVLRGSQEQPK
jgi:hypothetical protein